MLPLNKFKDKNMKASDVKGLTVEQSRQKKWLNRKKKLYWSEVKYSVTIVGKFNAISEENTVYYKTHHIPQRQDGLGLELAGPVQPFPTFQLFELFQLFEPLFHLFELFQPNAFIFSPGKSTYQSKKKSARKRKKFPKKSANFPIFKT